MGFLDSIFYFQNIKLNLNQGIIHYARDMPVFIDNKLALTPNTFWKSSNCLLSRENVSD